LNEDYVSEIVFVRILVLSTPPKMLTDFRAARMSGRK